MESEQSQNFNDRLSQWVANQGFWFQLRYSMSSSGARGTAMFHLLTLGSKLLVFLLIVAGGCWLYLAKRTATEKFNSTLKADLISGLSASEIQVGGFSRDGGELGINALAGQGGEQTFFTSFEAKNVRGQMGFLDGIIGQWDLGTINISKLEISLRAGADDAESARSLSDVVFRKSDKVLARNFEVADASLQWGYRKNISPSGDLKVTQGQERQAVFSSEHTCGSISNSLMKVQRETDSMRLIFKGGTFTQNWLQRLEIIDIVVNCDRDGLTFETARFKRGQGTVDFSGLRVTAGSRPILDGVVKIRHLDLNAIVPAPVRSFVEGTLSGDFKVSGSTNEAQGIVYEGDVTVDDSNMISLRERIPLLKALSMVDYSRKYRRVDFREGSFHLKVAGGGLTLSEVKLKANDLLTLEGNLKVRLPTAEETMATLSLGTPRDETPTFNEEEASPDSKEGADDFSLRQAAIVAKRDREAGQRKDGATGSQNVSLFEKLNVSQEARRLEEKSAEYLSRALRYEGSFTVTLLPDAFERAPKLAAEYPVDSKLGRIRMVVPIAGAIYDVTQEMGDALSLEGTR